LTTARVPEFRRFLFYKLKSSLKENKVHVILGVRQVGKTTLLLQLANEIFGSHNIFYIPVDAVIENVGRRAVREAVSVIEKYYLGKKLHLVKRPTVIIFDEVHFDSEWGVQVKVLYDKLAQWGAPVKIIVTGSSALSIKVAIAKYLTGRVEIEYMNPMSLAEFIVLKEGLKPALIEAMERSLRVLIEDNPFPVVEDVLAILSPVRPTLEKALREMLVYGGMPEVLAKNLRGADAQRTLESYVYITLFKDVLKILDYLGERIKLAGKLDKLIRIVLYRSPRILSVNSIATDLGVSPETAEQYLDLILATHITQRADNYSKSPIVEARKKKLKYYSCDTGIRNAVIWGIMPRRILPEEEGLLLENMALIHAKRVLKRINWKREPKFIKVKDKEGDIVMEYGEKTMLIEVKRKEKRIKQPQNYGIDRILQIALYEEEKAIPAIVFMLADPIHTTLRKQL